MFQKTIDFIRNLYSDKDFIALHEPFFDERDKELVIDAIESTYVSSVGKYVDQFENKIIELTGAKYAIATVNGTAALHIALIVAGVTRNDLVITQPLSFIATCNSISYVGAYPLFIDVDLNTLSLSPIKLNEFLEGNCIIKNNTCFLKKTGQKISACIPMHTFGHPARINEILDICNKYNIALIEDAAESIGSYYDKKHTGTFGLLGTFSFNGNKTITCGGGGMIITDNEDLAILAKHLTTQAKKPHKWKYDHDMIGYNYRLPNLNAALACAQFEKLNRILENKRKTSNLYRSFFKEQNIHFVIEPEKSQSNYWLNAVLLRDEVERNIFLEETNTNGVMTRPAWTLINKFPMFSNAIRGELSTAMWLEERLVNIPSSVIL